MYEALGSPSRRTRACVSGMGAMPATEGTARTRSAGGDEAFVAVKGEICPITTGSGNIRKADIPQGTGGDAESADGHGALRDF